MSRALLAIAMAASCFLLPQLGSHPHLVHPAPWLAMGCAVLMLLTQPSLDAGETVRLSAADRGSAIGIFATMIGAQIGAALEFRLHLVQPLGPSFYSGIALIVSGMAFRIWSIRTLGEFFTANVRVVKGQRVVQSGPYRLLRHPSYTGAIVAAVGTALVFGSMLGLALITLLVAPAYAYRMQVEEARLASDLGPEYRDYMRKTRRLVPFVY